MKAKLETPALSNRGVELESETEEEKAVLLDLWLKDGRTVCLKKLASGVIDGLGYDIKGNVRLSIAPTAAEEDKIT